MSCSTSCSLRDASEVSSRRARSIFILLPPTSRPPASFTSLTANSVACLYALPILDSLPVTGRTAPIRIAASWAAAGPEKASASERTERAKERFERMPVIEASSAALAAISVVWVRVGILAEPRGRGRASRVPFAVRSEVEDLHLDRELVRREADLGGHTREPDLDVEVVLGLRVRVEVEPADVSVLVLGHAGRRGERLLFVADDRGDLGRLDEDARLDRERVFLRERRDERAAVDVLVRDRRLERAEGDREVHEEGRRGELVVSRRVVGPAEGEDFPVAEVSARVRRQGVDLGVEEVPLEAFREARRVLDAGLAEAREEGRTVLEGVAEEVAPEHDAGIAVGVVLQRGARHGVVGGLVEHERGRAAREDPAVDGHENLAELDVELLGGTPLADGVEEVEASRRRLDPRRPARQRLRGLAEARVLGIEVEENVLGDLPAQDETGPAEQHVLLPPSRIVVGRVRDLLEVGLPLEQDAEPEIDVVVDLDEGLGFGPAERKQEKGGDEASGGRPQCAVRGNRHESFSPPEPDVSNNGKDNGTLRAVQWLMRLNHMTRLRTEGEIRENTDRERSEAGRHDARPPESLPRIAR